MNIEDEYEKVALPHGCLPLADNWDELIEDYDEVEDSPYVVVDGELYKRKW